MGFMGNTFAVVTGASSGIGKELAKVLAGKGYDLLIAAESDRLEYAVSELTGLGVEVQGVQANLADKEGVDTFWKAIEATGRPVDIACLNVGVGVGGLFVDTDLDAELNMVLLNCAGTVHLAKHVVKKMVGRGEGRILFTASIVSEMVAPREAVYAATKAFVLSFAKSLHFELKDTGVGVTALQPGPVIRTSSTGREWTTPMSGRKERRIASRTRWRCRGSTALMDGKEHVYAASFKTKLQGAVANFVPDAAKAAMHEKMAKPPVSAQEAHKVVPFWGWGPKNRLPFLCVVADLERKCVIVAELDLQILENVRTKVCVPRLLRDERSGAADKRLYGTAGCAIRDGRCICGPLIVAVPRSAKGIGMKSLSSWWKQRPAEATSGVAHSATMVMVAPEPVKAATESIRYIARQAIFERSKKVFGVRVIGTVGVGEPVYGGFRPGDSEDDRGWSALWVRRADAGDSEFHQLHAGVAG